MELIFSSKSGAKLWVEQTETSCEFLSDNPEEITRALSEDARSINPVDRDMADNLLHAIYLFDGIRKYVNKTRS